MSDLQTMLYEKEAWLRATPGIKFANVKLDHAALVDILAALEITKNVVTINKSNIIEEKGE